MSYHENNIYLMSLSILITALLDSGWILEREVRFQSLLGVKGLNITHQPISSFPNLVRLTRFCH